MQNKEIIQIACSICAGMGAITTPADDNIKDAPQKPNIIFFLSDYSGIGDYEPYGQKKIKTPNIAKLATEGMKFTQHYAGSTVCAPSRCTLMQGMHTGHSTVRGNNKNVLNEDDYLVSQMLKEAGYTNMIIGKWGLGDSADGPGDPAIHGFDYFYGFRDQGRAHHYYPDYIWKNHEKVEFPDNPEKRTDYIHDHFTEEGLKFVKEHKDKPFFLYMAYTMPHSDLDVPEDSMAEYHPMFDPEKYAPGAGKGGFPGQPTPHAAYAGMITRMDRDIGRFMELIKQLGIDDNTIVIFSVDNGAPRRSPKHGADPNFFDSNGPFRGYKRDVYEGGVRTPLIVRWPGKIEANSSTDHISAFWDFFPTVAEIIGVKPPDNLDGISYLPTLLGHPEDQKKHKYLYWEFFEQGGKQAVRMGDWKAVRVNVSGNFNTAPIELYNIKKDEGETNNIADQHPEMVQQMFKIMKEGRVSSPKYSFKEKDNKKQKGKEKPLKKNEIKDKFQKEDAPPKKTEAA